MKKQNGFIATSLIYSFFLVFITIITALVGSYINNKLILERFNDSAMDELNSNTYSVNIQSTTGEIEDGIVLTNLIESGDFIDNSKWENNTTCLYESNYDGLLYTKKNCNIPHSYIKQPIDVKSHNIYYYSSKYSNSEENDSKIYLDNPSYGNIKLSKTENWIRESQTYLSTSTKTVDYVLGDNNDDVLSSTKFAEPMVINLTEAFGEGKEPKKDWIDKNIEYFENESYLYIKENIKENTSISVKLLFKLQEDKYLSIKCQNSFGDYHSKDTSEYEPEPGTTLWYTYLTIDNVNENIKCYVSMESLPV